MESICLLANQLIIAELDQRLGSLSNHYYYNSKNFQVSEEAVGIANSLYLFRRGVIGNSGKTPRKIESES